MSAGEFQPAIIGIGGAFGSESISNDELIQRTGIVSGDEWIRGHTSIEHRYWAGEGTLAADLGTEAAIEALKRANLSGEDVSAIYLTTLTPDYLGPYTATEVHRRLNAPRKALALELQAACSGGVIALREAAKEVLFQPDATVLTVGTELMSRVLNLQDRQTVILFGDGAGATVVRGLEGAEKPVFSVATAPDREAIYAPTGGVAEPGNGPNDVRSKLHMDGKRVARHALTLMPEVLLDTVMTDGALNPDGTIDWDRYNLFIPHQANGNLIEKLWDGLQVPEEKRVLTVDQHGNTSSASVLLALHDAYQNGRLQDHGRILMTSVGAGMVAAAGAIDVHIDA